MMKHTKEPWHTKREGFSTVYVEARIGGGWVQEVAACGPTANGSDEQEANARRIVACVNACAGISTDSLESEGSAVMGWNRTARKLIDATNQRDELLAALERIEGSFEFGSIVGIEPDGCVRLLEFTKKIITSIKGESK